jgi:hypothetical protein
MRSLRAFSLLLLLGAGAAAHAQTVGFAVNSDRRSNTGEDELLRITLETGVAVESGADSLEKAGVGNAFGDIEALAFGPSNVLYGADDQTKTLLRFNVATGAATPAASGLRGNLGLPSGLGPEFNFDFGMSYACDGVMYLSSDGKRSLYRVNLTTGAAERVGAEGAMGAQITGLAARGNTLYGLGASGDEGLWTIDTTTARATLVGRLGGGFSFTDGDLAFDGQGRLWGVSDRSDVGANGEESQIFRIDPLTGAATLVSTSVVGLESLAIAPTACTLGVGPTLPVSLFDWRWAALLALLLVGLTALSVTRRR